MSIVEFDLEINQAASNPFEFQWVDSNGLPADFTGCKAFLQVRQAKMAPVVLIELSTENGRITFDGNSIVVNFLPSDTESALWNRAYYDLLLVYQDGFRIRFSEGRVRLSRAVTRGVNQA